MVITEVHIGTRFSAENCNVDFASAIKNASDDALGLASLCKPGAFESPSSRNGILFKCADIIIDLAQSLKSIGCEQPNSTIQVDPRELKTDWLNVDISTDVGIQALCLGSGLALASKSNLDDTADEEKLEAAKGLCLQSIDAMCLIPAALGEADLEPYILQRISERG